MKTVVIGNGIFGGYLVNACRDARCGDSKDTELLNRFADKIKDGSIKIVGTEDSLDYIFSDESYNQELMESLEGGQIVSIPLSKEAQQIITEYKTNRDTSSVSEFINTAIISQKK